MPPVIMKSNNLRKTNMNTLQDRLRGSLVGGAIGDALGYPVEFIGSFREIQLQYGNRGITRLDTECCFASKREGEAKAVFSDDTQMTLFTANGLLNAPRLGMEPIEGICRAYLEWCETQRSGKRGDAECWIRDVPELNNRRAPGITCLSALEDIKRGVKPFNNSKGCGGVMRVAPVALYAVVNDRMDILQADRLAGDAAEITHKHPLGFISAALMAHVIYRLAIDTAPTREVMKRYILEGNDAMRQLYGNHSGYVENMAQLAELAIELSGNDRPDLDNLSRLGQGWVGEEALAVGLYCALKYFDNFEEAMIASVNHGGDSDSTGAIAGNILGAAIGYEAIPQFYKNDVEMLDLLLHMADDLYRGEVTPM